jgi:hypothetical protein
MKEAFGLNIKHLKRDIAIGDKEKMKRQKSSRNE